MKVRSISITMMVLVTLLSVQFLSADQSRAVGAKESARSGKIVVVENTAAELLQPAYDIKNKPVESIYPVPRPPFSSGVFPCTQCHAYMTPNPKRRVLNDYHEEIVLHHAEGQRWCTDCHNLTNRDKLRLVSGELIDFTESYRLCGQCHGDKFRDWKVGVHGKRTGNWNGDKQYLLCVHCHNPHDPKFKPLKPMAPPNRPGKAHE